MKDPVQYSEDSTESISLLFKLRIPPLIIGFALGIGLSFVTSRFEEVIDMYIAVAFFIPFVIYIADAVGTQTQTIYIRSLKTGKGTFKTYLIKETILGILLGIFFSIITAIVVWLWYGSLELTLAISISMFFSVFSAPLIALITTRILQLERTDPAVSAGPISTVIQDAASILIYGAVCSLILL